MDHSRRNFIKNTLLTCAAAGSLSLTKACSSSKKPTSTKELPHAAVILFQGDSITDGNRGRDQDPNHVMGHGYAFSIASRIGADYYKKEYQFINRGISGDKVIDLQKRWQNDTLDLNPDVLSVLIGINDAASVADNWEPVVTTQQFFEVYDQLLSQAIAQNPDLILVLGFPFLMSGSRTKNNWEVYVDDIKKRQAIVHNLSEKYNAVLVNFQQVFDEACQKAPLEYWIWDGVHPTVAGHELMARKWIEQVENRIQF